MSLLLPPLSRMLLTPKVPRLISPFKDVGWASSISASTSVSIARPAQAHPGLLSIYIGATYGTTTSPSTPSGYTSISVGAGTGTSIGLRVAAKWLLGDEANPLTATNTGATMSGSIQLVIEGVKNAGDVTTFVKGTQSSAASGTTPNPPSVSAFTDHAPHSGLLWIASWWTADTDAGAGSPNTTTERPANFPQPQILLEDGVDNQISFGVLLASVAHGGPGLNFDPNQFTVATSLPYRATTHLIKA